MPVELSSFLASVVNSYIELKWTTETEINNYGFEIQKKEVRSQETEWNTIGFVEGSGNSNSPKEYTYIDYSILNGSAAQYRLKQIDNDGRYEFSDVINIEFIPSNLALHQNYPNPFNPSTVIRYNIPASLNPSQGGTLVTLKVYDILGNEVATLVDDYREAGMYEVEFQSTVHSLQSGVGSHQLASGIYLYRLEAGAYVETKKMILLK